MTKPQSQTKRFPIQNFAIFIVAFLVIGMVLGPNINQVYTGTSATGSDTVELTNNGNLDTKVRDFSLTAPGGVDGNNFYNLLTLNPTSESVSDLQVRKTILYQSGMKSDFSDVRFYTADGVAVSYYFIPGTLVSGVSVDVELKIPQTSSTESLQLLQRFGNNDLVSESSGSAVFPDLFKDFEDDDLSDWDKDVFTAFETSTDYVSSGTKSLKVYWSGTGFRYASLPLTGLDNNHVIEFDFLEKSGNNYLVSFVIDDAIKSMTGLRSGSRIFNDNTYAYLDNSVAWQNIATGLSTNIWYRIAINPDVNTDTFDASISSLI